jgi:transcriptional regulator with XRE-family HTH domain
MQARAEFDLQALQDALDAERRARGLSWAALARAVGVSASTLRRLGTRRAVEGDGVLQMLRWLGRSPESFVSGGGPRDGDSVALPTAPRGVLRFDARALHAALEARRRDGGMTWEEVAAAIGGTNAGALRRLRGGGRVAFPPVMRVCAWLGEPVARFVHLAPR